MPTREDVALDPMQDTSTVTGEGNSLADLILEKIALHEAANVHEPRIQGGGAPEDAVELPAKVVEVYSKWVTGLILSSRLTMLHNQDWAITITVQIWQITQTLQSHPQSTSVGRAALYNAAGVVDSKRMLRSYKDLRFRQTIYYPEIPAIGHPRPCARGHPRKQKIECALIQSAQEGLVQACCLLQRFPFPPARQRYLYATGSSYYLQHTRSCLDTSATLRSWSSEVDRNCS